MPQPTPHPHRTPLRRSSQGSLFALSRSAAYLNAPHGLEFLEPAMSEFVDETETLQANVEGMRNLSQSLTTFNESFASWLYIMNMNALTTDWPQAPSDASFVLAKRRVEQSAAAALESMRAAQAAAARQAEQIDQMATTESTHGEITHGNTTTNVSANALRSGSKKKTAKHKLNAKEKKERSIEIEKTISCLPLEFRGSDPNLRRNMELVIEGLLDNSPVKLADLIIPPDLSQARVNKCLIALVNRKIVLKENATGTVLYHWRGMP